MTDTGSYHEAFDQLQQAIASGNLDGATEAIFHAGPLREKVVDCLFKHLEQQYQALCRKKDFSSILRGLSPKELLSFSFDRLAEEWKANAPLLIRCLTVAANVTPSESGNLSTSSLAGICSAGAILLRQRNVHLSALHHIIGLILFHGNASKMVCNIG